MEGNKGYLTSATWNAFTYAEAYAEINSRCTTPKALTTNFEGLQADSNNLTVIMGLALPSIVALTIGGLVFLRKKKQQF